MTWWSRLLLDGLVAMVGIVTVFLAVALVVDGVEQLRLLAEGRALIALLLERLPVLLSAVVPVASSVAVLIVLGGWRRRGALLGLAASGVGPGSVALVLALGCTLVGAASIGVREALSHDAAPSGWLTADVGGLSVVAHGEVEGNRVVDLGVIWRDGSRLIAVGTAPVAERSEGGWVVMGGGLRAIGERPVPDLSGVRLSSGGPGAKTPIRDLLAASPSPGRSAWIFERALPLYLAFLLSLQAGLLGQARHRAAGALAVGCAIAASLTAVGLVDAVALGIWSVWGALATVSLLPLVAGAIGSVWCGVVPRPMRF